MQGSSWVIAGVFDVYNPILQSEMMILIYKCKISGPQQDILPSGVKYATSSVNNLTDCALKFNGHQNLTAIKI